MTIVEVTEPPDTEAPLHVHHLEDEAFWILAGERHLRGRRPTIEARAGDYLFGPRHIPHRYTTGPDGCRMLFIFTPGGFEGAPGYQQSRRRRTSCRPRAARRTARSADAGGDPRVRMRAAGDA